jgi:hypothetical protein
MRPRSPQHWDNPEEGHLAIWVELPVADLDTAPSRWESRASSKFPDLGG